MVAKWLMGCSLIENSLLLWSDLANVPRKQPRKHPTPQTYPQRSMPDAKMKNNIYIVRNMILYNIDIVFT